MAAAWRQKRQHPCAQDVPVSQVAFSPGVSPGGSRDVLLRLIGCLCAGPITSAARRVTRQDVEFFQVVAR